MALVMCEQACSLAKERLFNYTVCPMVSFAIRYMHQLFMLRPTFGVLRFCPEPLCFIKLVLMWHHTLKFHASASSLWRRGSLSAHLSLFLFVILQLVLTANG